MVKENKTLNQLFWIKICREIKSNIKQFFALILIAGLAVTLFVGLSSNAQNLRNRVDKLYEDGNIADIFVYVSNSDEEEFNDLSNLPGVEKIEKRFALDQCVVYQNSGTLLIQDEKNEICKPAELTGAYGLVIDSMFASLNDIKIGDEIKIELPYAISYFADEETAERIDSYSDDLLKENAEFNPLKQNLLFKSKVTGTMQHPETVEREYTHGTCMMNTQTFNDLLQEFLKKGFNDDIADLIYKEFTKYEVINQYLIKVKDNVSINEVNEEVYQYFNPSSYDKDEYLVSSKLWGKYSNNKYNIKVNEHTVILNDEEYEVIENKNNILTISNGTNSYKLDLNENSLGIYVNNKFYSLVRNNASNFVTSLTVENLPSTATLEQDIYQAKQLLYVFPTIFFVVAALVIMTSLSQTIFRSRQEIGTMKALGIPNYKIMLHYICLGITLSMIGVIIGSIVGPLIIPNVMNIKYDILYNLPTVGIVYPIWSIILCIAIFVVLSSLVTFGVTYSEIRLKPVESMRAKPEKEFKPSRFDIQKEVSSLKLSLKMAWRNIFAKKTRMIMVVFGVMGCTALTVAGFGILDSINYGLNIDLYELYQSDLSINYKGTTGNYEILTSFDEVESVQEFTTKVLRAQTDKASRDMYMYVYEQIDGENAYSFLDGVKDGIAIAESVANELGVKENDKLSIIYLGKAYELNVDVIYESSYWLSLYTFKNNVIDLGYEPTSANVNVKEGVDIATFEQKIKDNTNLDSITSVAEFQSMIDDTLSSVKLMCNTVKVFAILLAIVVTYNLANLNFIERKRDISTLKVLGFSSQEIALSLVFELMFLTVVGVIFGLFLGYPIVYLIMTINETNLLHYIYYIKPLTYVIASAISLGTAIIVNAYSAYLAGKVDAVSALKSVE